MQLIQHESLDFCIKSSNKYCSPVFNVLETEAKVNIFLIQPKHIKAINNKKN